MRKENNSQTTNLSTHHTNKPIQLAQPALETAVSTPFPSLQRAYTDPGALSPAEAQTLQRTIGNQALGRLTIQRKMTLGPVGDKYEQEADAVAKQVVGRLHTSPAQSVPTQTTQRQEEEDELQMKPLLQRQEEKEELQAKGDPMLAGGDLSGEVETAVSQAKSGGQPLNDNVRQPMENAFNADFSRVKIHTGGQADNLNRSLSARAFTSGRDVFFRSGEYNPGSSSGQELIAHELTHTIQQGAASLQRQPAPTLKKPASNLFLLGGLGAVSPHLIQRAQALTIKNQPTYKPDPQDATNVLNTSIRGTRRTNNTIDHYQQFDVADQAAPNKASYYKITNGPFQGEFVYRPNYLQVNALNETRAVKLPTHIKEGKSGAAWEAAQPGDLLQVTGKTEDDAYLIARNKRIQNGKRGSIAQEKTRTTDAELTAVGAQLSDAATTDKSVSLYKPLSDDRQKSVGIDQNPWEFIHSGATLKADFTAAGINAKGEKSLIAAESVRRQDAKGYVEKAKVRKITDTTTALTQEFQSQPNNQGAQLEQITTDFVVTGKTYLRQPQQNSDGSITFKDSYDLEPGEILERTAESRAVFKQDKNWATEMKWRGKVLGMVNMDKSQALTDDQKAVLKLNTPVDGIRAKNTLQKVLVTEKTTLRAIKDNRVHTFAIGPMTVPLKKDTAVYADFSIKGVDETFSYNWIFAQTEDNKIGYIREEKVTNPHTEGNVREVVWDGANIEGNEIPAGNQYIYKKTETTDGKRGDRFVPVLNQAVADHKYYYNLRNHRTGAVCRIEKEDVILASLPLVAANPPNTMALVLGKAHLREPVESRLTNSGASDKTLGEQLQAGDKLQVNFQTVGVFDKGDTEWYYAQKGNHLGYIRGSKIRESGAEQLQAINQNQVPDRFIPAYVSGKTHLRDDKKSKQEAKKAGDQIMVNYDRHPTPFVRKGNTTGYIANPHYAANELDRWLLVQDDRPRYIREHKTTVQFLQPEYKPPSAGKSSGTAYQAFKIISGGVKDVNFESAGGWGVGTTGDIYEGFKGVKGMEEGQEIESGFLKNPSEGPTHGGEYHNLAIAGVTGGMLGLIGTVEGLIEVFGPGRNWKERLLGMLKITESGLAGVVASARAAENIYAIKDSRLQSSSTAAQGDNYEAFKLAGEVAGWAAGIANAIGAVKGLFLSIHSFVTSHKKAPERGIGLLKGLLEAGQAGVKAARFLTKVFDATGTSNVLAVTVPFIGLAVDMADIVLGAIKWARGHTGETDSEELLRQDALKQKVTNAFDNTPIDRSYPHKNEKNKLFWKEFRGVRSVNTLMTKTTYLRLNPKILFAIRNKEQLDKRRGIGANHQVVERSARYINSDYYQVVTAQDQPTGTVVVIIDGQHIEVTPAAQKSIHEYELVSKVQEVSKKKKIYGIEELEKGIMNLIGDVLGMGGPTAMAGAIIKGVTAAADAGFNLARFINKQMDNKQGKKYASHLKYQGKIEGTDKSQAKKQREYYDHAIFILQEIGDLAGPAQILAAAQDQGTLNLYRQQYIKVQKHVEITGVHTKLFYEAAGKPVDQVELLVEALSER